LPSVGAVTRQHLRPGLGDIRKLALDGFGDASMERASRLPQQCAIGRILNQRMLEQLSGVRGDSLSKEQTSSNKTM
jgi:hypothetical protein